jgi:hypothetical protein
MPSQTLEALFDTLLDALQREFEIDHAMVLMYEGERQCLATVASRGYGASGSARKSRWARASSAWPRAPTRPSASAT